MTTVGVSGHIGIRPETRLVVAARIAEELSRLPGPLRGYTSLAAGSDQVFAWAVLAAGGDIVFVNPCASIESTMPPEALPLFRAARGLAVEEIALPYDEPSEDAYLAAGEYIDDVADVLIVVYDGLGARGKGGTGDIVARREATDRVLVNVWPDGHVRD
ncbi:hypothetical protein RB608_10270 [Nocardioides sp. LHD-245]|uniref:hypothetical protein n=1 Tax=Nocardioides sp. LHD-245 TaxID=3051387 RepID=UPI0027E187BF|nr:hypothetical protein [Nocardioides sp. LHD-245]